MKDAFTNNLHERSDFGVLHESWQLSLSLRRADGHGLAFLNPYFQVFLPSRFNDGLNVSGPTLGRNRDYGGPRVHAPN